MPKRGQFSLTCLIVEIKLIGAAIGVTRQAVVTWGHSLWTLPMVAVAVFLSITAYALGRVMIGADEPPDFPARPFP